eukprot:46277-Eustigmatos_ZCMA.PRE.1
MHVTCFVPPLVGCQQCVAISAVAIFKCSSAQGLASVQAGHGEPRHLRSRQDYQHTPQTT